MANLNVVYTRIIYYIERYANPRPTARTYLFRLRNQPENGKQRKKKNTKKRIVV